MFNTEVRITWTDEDGNFGTGNQPCKGDTK